MMFRRLPLFFQLYLGLLLPLVASLYLLEHGEILLAINDRRTGLLDWTMPWITYLGDGVFFAVASIGLIVWNWRMGLFVGISGGIMSGVVAFFKRVVFSEVPRPKRYFAETDLLQFIEGVRVAGKFSFPSGHTTTIFMLGGLLALLFPGNRMIQVGILLIAILTGFSRIYLLQHFYVDVVAGSVLGIALAMIFWRWLRPFFEKKLEND